MKLRRFVYAAVLSVLGACALFAQDQHLRRALELFGQQQYAQALEEFEKARAAQPGNPAIENALGITETKLGQMEEADRHYLQAIRLNPNAEDPHKNLGFNYLNLGRFDLAEKELKTALRLQPGDAFPHLYLAMVYVATSRDQLAVEEVNPSLELLPNDPQIALQLVKSCLHADRTEQAGAIVAAVDRKSGFSLDQRRELASVFFEKHLYRQAVEQFRRVADDGGSLWQDRFNLAGTLLNEKKFQEAIPILTRIASERPNDTTVLALLGSACEGANQMPQALDAYRKEAQSNPSEADAYLDYTRLLMDLARYDEAQDFVLAGLKVVREPYPLYMRLGSVQMMASKYDPARAWFQKAIDEHPEIPVGYVALAQICFKTGQNEEAAKLLTDARQKLKPDFLLEYYYGLAADRIGEKQECIVALQKAVALNPGIAEIHFELGRVYFETNRTDSSRSELEKAIKIDPQFAKSYIFLSRIYARLGDSSKAHELAEQAKRFKQDERQEGIRAQESRLRSFQPLQSR